MAFVEYLVFSRHCVHPSHTVWYILKELSMAGVTVCPLANEKSRIWSSPTTSEGQLPEPTPGLCDAAPAFLATRPYSQRSCLYIKRDYFLKVVATQE